MWVKERPFHPTVHTQVGTMSPPCCQQAQERASFFTLASCAGTEQLCHQWLSHHALSSTKDLQVLSQVWHRVAAPLHINTQPSARFPCWTLLQFTENWEHLLQTRFVPWSKWPTASQTRLSHHEPSWLPRAGLSLNPADTFCYLLFMIFSLWH